MGYFSMTGTQSELFEFEKGESIGKRNNSNGTKNIYSHDIGELPVQNWYSIIAGYSGNFVSDSIREWNLTKEHTLFDPFAGSGTTLLSAQLRQVRGLGYEVHPFHHFCSKVKTNWHLEKTQLINTQKIKKRLKPN